MNLNWGCTLKKFYQTEWQGIQFSDFAQMSSKNLANSEFYQEFYQEFFKRHQNWDRLSTSWYKEKERCAEFVLTRSGVSSKILSVGCGLGAMEHYMHTKEPQLDLFIHEVAPSAWHWIEAEFTEKHKFLGLIPACLPDSIRFDLIYLSAVDYAMDDDVLVSLLTTLRSFLINGGQCLLISASFQNTPVTLRDKAISFVRGLKASVAAALAISRLRPLGQFWGWSRTQNEYQALMRHAGYREIEDGFIDHEKQAHYWISGR